MSTPKRGLVASTDPETQSSMVWSPEQFTSLEYSYEKPHGLQVPPSVNLRADPKYQSFFDDNYQQGQTGSCVANATAACYSFELRKYVYLYGLARELMIPSRLFIYYNARAAISQQIVDKGCFIRHAFKSLSSHGVCPEAQWPYDESKKNHKPPDVCFREALKYKIYKHERLDIHRSSKGPSSPLNMDADGDIVLDNVRSCLAASHPVVFSFNWKIGDVVWHWTRIGANNTWAIHAMSKQRHAKVPLPKTAHAVMGIGYDDELEQVLCQNSMGPLKSLFWIPYDWITDFYATSDFWCLKMAAGANPP